MKEIQQAIDNIRRGLGPAPDRVISCLRCSVVVPLMYDDDPEAGVLCRRCQTLAWRREHWEEMLVNHCAPDKMREIPVDLALPDFLSAWRGDPWCVAFVPADPQRVPNGTGKTWMATRLWGDCLLRGVDSPPASHLERTPSAERAYWADVSWAVERMRRELSEPATVPTFDRLCESRLLLLDDLAAMRDTEWGRERIRLVVKARHNRIAPTIITSDRPVEEVEPRLASRIAERSSGRESFIVAAGGRDRRTSP